jgi:CDP-6-deoxy-D-xylo-4-hexulose-3-dehydrase
MDDKKENILKLISEYINEKHSVKTWTAGKDWVQYSGPHFDSDEFVAAANTLLNEWLVLGNDAIILEKTFPKLMGKEFGVVTNSGSSANLLMMAALKSKNLNGFDKVNIIVPVAGFPTTLNPLLQMGFNPIFVDIELDTLNIDVNKIEELIISSNAKVITFAHVLGNPPNMDKIMELVNKYNLILLEDCCDGLGSTYDGKPLGSFGDFASCSFYPAHHITGGEGGFVSCKTKQQEKVVKSLRDWGRGCFCTGKEAGLSKKGCCGKRFSKWLPSLSDTIFDHKYVYNEIGFNLKPIEIQCSMLLQQIKKLPIIDQKRKSNYKRLFDIFSGYENLFILPKPTNKSDPSWFAFPLTIKNTNIFNRFDFCEYLENNKIQTRNYFGGNLLLQPAYQNLGFSKEYAMTFENATKVTTDTFFLGTSPVITDKQLTYIEEITHAFLKSYK